MEFKDKIKLIYDMLIDGIELTKENMMANGLSQEDIWQLEDNGVLLKVKKQPYRLKSVEKFRQYGVSLLMQAKKEKEIDVVSENEINEIFKRAYKCFEICYKMSPSELKICYHVLLSRIKQKRYNEVFEVFVNLSKNKNSFMDTKFILYLLSFITELPKEHCQKVLDFKEKDISLLNTANAFRENECRRLAFKQKFSISVEKMSGLCNKNHDEYSPKFQLVRGLLIEADNFAKELQKKLLRLVENKDYQEIVKVLETKSKTRQLSHKEQSILLVAKEILRLSNSRVILEPTIDSKNINKKGIWFNMEEMLRAIKGNNFDLAFRECTGYMEESKSKEENMVLYYLLSSWKSLSSKFKNEACILTKNDTLVPLYELDYSNEDREVIEAYSIVSEGLKDNISLEDIIKGSGLFNSETKLLVKLVYARYCYYNAMKCYDLAYELFELESNDYYKVVKLFYEYMACGDKIINNVKKSLSISPKVEAFIIDIESYKKKLQLNSQSKKLVKE